MADPAEIVVIIPHLNAPEALDRCLASLAAERAGSAPGLEAIVVDNGSAEMPAAVCAGYPFVRLEAEAEPGPGPARNHGARLATAPILAFIDADCTACPGWIAAIRRHFADDPQAAAIGGDVRIACVDPARPTAIEAYESVYGYRFKLYIRRHGYTGAGNMAVRREVFAAVGGFAGIGVAEDVDWGRRARALGFGIDYVPEMAIATPARGSFDELARKWDRHISHGYAELRGAGGRLRWALKALALAVSPLAELPRLALTRRLSGRRARLLAFACLVRIRLYRCRRMLGLLAGGGQPSSAIWRNG